MIINEPAVFKDEFVSVNRKRNPIEDHDDFVENTKDKRRAITVEPLVLFYIIVLYLQTALLSQYIYYRVGIDYNISSTGSRAYVCDRNSNKSAEKDKTDRLQDLSSTYMMYIALSSAVFTILTAPFYSVFSDRYGRRFLFLLPGIGSVLKSLFEVLIIIFNWQIFWFVITEGLFGLSGGFNFGVGLSYSYIADISSTKTRTKRLAILISMMIIGTLIASLITGYWIAAQGYLIPYIFSAGVSVLCLIYPIFFLQEPLKMPGANEVKLPPLKQLRTLISIYIGRPRHQTIILILVIVMFNFYYIAEMSAVGIIPTYLMSFPLCMTSITMGYYSFLNMLATNVGILVSVVGMSKYISELYIILICHLSGLCYFLQLAFASGPSSAYIAAASNPFSFSAFQFIRGFLSKQVSPYEQGALFGGLLLCETIGAASTKVVVLYFYKETFHIFHGMVFLFIACFNVVAFMLTILTTILDWRNKRKNKYKEFN